MKYKIGQKISHKLTMEDMAYTPARDGLITYINEVHHFYMVVFNVNGHEVRECYHFWED